MRGWVQNSIFIFILEVKLSGEPAIKRGKLPGVFLRLWRHIESLVMDVEPSSLKVSGEM